MSHVPDFSRLLTQYLAQRDRSPAWLARRLDVHPATVGRWLNQDTRPATPELVIRVADVLGIHTATERQAILAAAGFAYHEGVSSTESDGVTVRPPAEVTKPIEDAPHLAATSVPTRLAQVASSLPVASTSFVGRESELAQLAEQFANPAVRLVTIVALGGMGKSRLALEFAARRLAQAEEEVCFVALAPVTSAAQVPAALAAALNIQVQGVLELEAHLVRLLSAKRLFLILDNLEHLLDAAPFIERILEGAAGVKILATSRVRLRIDKEWLLPLEGLTIPNLSDSASAVTMESAAVKLFVQRARQLQPDFALSEETTAHIIRICRLVGGMPLGIELAAAWLRVVPLGEIAKEIEANLDFLVTSMRSESERHRSMRAVFDRSWQLLSAKERSALARFSLFRGGFDRQAAASVGGADLRTLSVLIDSSWLQLNASNRYGLHELVRQYAEEKLKAEPPVAQQAGAAHSAYYAALAELVGSIEGDKTARDLEILVTDLDNIWSGWHWAVAHRDFEGIGKYVSSLAWLADSRGPYKDFVAEFEEVCTTARQLLANPTGPPVEQRQIALALAQLLYHLCFLYGRAISVEHGLVCGRESLTLLRQLGLAHSSEKISPIYVEALVYNGAMAAMHADYQEARLYFDEIMQLTRGDHKQRRNYFGAMYALGLIFEFQGKFKEAERQHLTFLDDAPDDIDRGVVMDNLAFVYLNQGDVTRAEYFASEAYPLAVESGNWPQTASALLVQAECAMTRGHYPEAEQYLARSSAITEEMGNRYVHVRVMTGKGRLSRLLGRPVDAQAFYEQAHESAARMGRSMDAIVAQVGLGFCLLDQEKYAQAKACFHAALRAAWERRIMPEVIEATVGLAALKGYEGQARIADQWLRAAIAHPSCSKRVQVEAMEIRERIARAEAADPLHEEILQAPDATLEGVVLELLQ